MTHHRDVRGVGSAGARLAGIRAATAARTKGIRAHRRYQDMKGESFAKPAALRDAMTFGQVTNPA